MKTEANTGHTYFCGTSGLVLPYKNKSFYPPEFRESSRLKYYGSLFSSIEINSSFYKIPQASTVQKWAAEVPGGFQFTYKLWRDITHVAGLQFDPALVARFMQTIDACPKKGCLLVQFPPSLRYNRISKLRELLECLLRNDPERGWKLAFEFRHPDWYRAETYELLDQHGAGMVIHDKKGSQSPMEDPEAGFVYLRFHGPEGNYRGSYEEAFLMEYAGYVRDWIQQGRTPYIYFNNTMGDAVRNLRQLREYIDGL